MREEQTFGECLTELLRNRHMTVADLTRRMNYRSKTSISRLLRDEVRYSSIEDFMRRLEPVSAWLFTREEMNSLREAMEVSRIGRARYRFYRDMWHLVGEASQPRARVRLDAYGSTQVRTLRELAEGWHEAKRIEMVIVNSGYDSLFQELEALLRLHPDMDISIRHYLIAPDTPGMMARHLGALLAVLRDHRYVGYYQPWRKENRTIFGNGMNHMAVSGEMKDGWSFTQMLSLQDGESGFLYESGREDGFPAYFRRVVESGYPDAVPFRAQYPRQEYLPALADISRQYLNYEQNRGGCCLTMDICLELIAPEILKGALLDSHLKEVDVQSEEFRALYENHCLRYSNVQDKKKRSVYIFSGSGLERFVLTGRMNSHLLGMRPFTCAERAEILKDVVRRCRQNAYLTVRILQPDIRVRDLTMTVYDDLGVYIRDVHAGYDVGRARSEAFFLLPDFAAALSDFFRDELLDGSTLTEAESLELLEEMASRAGHMTEEN